MADEMQQDTGPGDTRIPLAYPIQTRDGTLTKDSKLVNCLIEPTVDKQLAVVKRFGLKVCNTTAKIPADIGPGQCLYELDGNVLSVVNNRICFAGSPFSGTPIPNFVALGGTLQIQSVPFNGLGFLLANPILKNAKGLVFGPSLTPPLRSGSYSYPDRTTPGIVALNGRLYVQGTLVDAPGIDPASEGAIYGSDAGDPQHWNSLNVVGVQAELGKGAGIIRHLTYVVGFYEFGTQFFYDAGNPPPGSPLAPVPNATFTTGCVNGEDGLSMQSFQDRVYFMSRSTHDGLGVSMLVGLNIQKISTPYVDRVLQRSNLQSIRSMTFRVNGHACYVLTLMDLGVSLCYDIDSGEWTQFSSVQDTVEGAFAMTHAVQNSGIQANGPGMNPGAYFLHATNGMVSSANDCFNNPQTLIYQDTVDFGVGVTAQPINTRIVTNPIDWGTLNMKRFPAGFLHADTVNSSVQVRYSDDDYQTFSTYRSIDLSYVRKQLVRLGGSRRRSWEFLHTANTPFRAYVWQLDIAVSNL